MFTHNREKNQTVVKYQTISKKSVHFVWLMIVEKLI